MRRQLERYAPRDTRLAGKIEQILAGNIDTMEPDITLEQLAERDEGFDEFAGLSINGNADIQRLFCSKFYFGCEADDPATAWAFSRPFRGAGIKPVFGSDISHFDVEDPDEVLGEAWEQVEHGFLSEQDFKSFTFTNAVKLHGRTNPDFFKGTVVEKQAAVVLAES